LPPPTFRENGISVTIRIYDEAEWIESCLLSFKDFANEIIIADNGSTDGSVEIVKDFIKEHPEVSIKFFDRSQDSYLEISNFVIAQTRYRWIMRVDGDFVAKTSGKYSIFKLKQQILALDPKYYYAIYLSLVFLDLDFFHYMRNRLRNNELYLYTYSPNIVCIREAQWSDKVYIPLYYKTLAFNGPFIFHLNIKSKMKVLYHRYGSDKKWLILHHGNKEPISIYIKKKVKEDFSVDSIEVAADLNIKYLQQNVVPFDASIYDGYPEVIEHLVSNPPFKLIYDENGNVVERLEP
jgi:glycosyltransferase involved in cell wall biosynthesis